MARRNLCGKLPVCVHCLPSPSLDTTVKTDDVPLQSSPAGWKLPSSLTGKVFPSQERCSIPFTTSGATHWTLSIMSSCLLYWRAQNWKYSSRYDFTGAKYRGRVTSLELLAILHLMQSRILLTFLVARKHHWFVFNSVLIRTSEAFLIRLIASWATGTWGCPSPCGGFGISLWTTTYSTRNLQLNFGYATWPNIWSLQI